MNSFFLRPSNISTSFLNPRYYYNAAVIVVSISKRQWRTEILPFPDSVFSFVHSELIDPFDCIEMDKSLKAQDAHTLFVAGDPS